MGNFCSECGSPLKGRSKPPGGSKAAKSAQAAPKAPRGPSAYNKRYSKAFKKHQVRFKKKSGGWKKNGYRSAVKAAHQEAGR